MFNLPKYDHWSYLGFFYFYMNLNLNVDWQYNNLVREIISSGTSREDRTGTGTVSLFGAKLQIDLKSGFPLLTSKKIHTKSVVGELLWFLRGDTNTKFLKDNGISIWEEWEDEHGEIGKMYGYQWRNLKVDQIDYVIDQLQNNPTSRRIIMSTWNVEQLDDMSLYPCHVLCQFYVNNNNTVDLQVYQRSADVGLGLPFNIASYSLLLHLICHCLGDELTPNMLHYVIGDAHIYKNHMDIMQNYHKLPTFKLPELEINPNKRNINQFEISDINFKNYECGKRIRMKVSV